MFQATVGGARADCKAVRRSLRLGTCLSGAAAALMVMAPAGAQASPALATGRVNATALSTKQRSAMAEASALPQDLTLVRPSLAAGSTQKAPANGVTLSGGGAVGVSGSPAVAGDLAIEVGDVETQGYREDGIVANTNNGGDDRNISITAGNVLTTGEASTGIRADAYTGDIAINAGSVSTTGYGSDAIYAGSWEGDATIQVGSVSTQGTGGRGITAYSGGTTTVVADSVTTDGSGLSYELDAGGIKAVGAAVNVHVGSVSTSGAYSIGIYANSNLVHDNGQANHDINVTAGQVITSGLGSDGIHVVNSNMGGNINIEVGSISTTGDYAWGAYAFSVDGTTSVTAGSISTEGKAATGVIAASYHGDVVVNANSITTSGEQAKGLEAYAAAGNISVDVGNVVTRGDGSDAIYAIAPGGTIDIKATSIATSGGMSRGVYAIGGSDISINVGDLQTSGDDSKGIYAVSLPIGEISSGAKISINAGSVTTTGDLSTAVSAFAATPDTDVVVKVGKITTSGFGSQGIFASSFSGDVDVATESVTTSGDLATAIVAYSIYGDVTVRADSVTTQGAGSNGIEVFSYTGKGTVVAKDVVTSGATAAGLFVRAAEIEIHTSGNITTNGAADAIVALAGAGGVTIRNDATITTNPLEEGYYNILARGMNIESQGDILVTGNGTITTNVDASEGILASSSTGGNIAISQQSVTTTGSGSVGLSVVSHTALGDGEGDIFVGVHDDVTTSGYSSSGMLLSNNTRSGDASAVVQGAVSTAGGYSRGVGIYSANGTARAQLAAITTKGVYSDAVHLDGHTTVASISGPISTQGDRSIGFVGYAGNGGVKLAASGPITTNGTFSSGVRISTAGAVELDLAGTISTSGRGASGIEVTERKRHREVYPYDPPANMGPDIPGPREPEEPSTGSLIAIKANAITTTGDRANGILASTTTGSVNIETGTVKTTGVGSVAIFAEGKSLTATTGNTSSDKASAIILRSYDSAQLDVRGTTTGAGDAVLLQGSKVTLSVGTNGSVAGTANGIVIDTTPQVTPIVHYWGYAPAGYPGQDEPQPIPPVNPPPGLAIVSNAGTITGGTGYALVVSNGRADIRNDGRIDGAVKLGAHDDLFANSGMFNATKDSNFDLGTDLFTNTGVVRVLTGAAANVSFLGLEKFDNRGGLVELRNGHGGDVFTLTGDYVGSGDAALGLDVAGTGADLFVVQGAATGKTQVVLTGLNAGEAQLTGNASITVIKTGAGSAADAFSLADSNIGFIQYGLNYNAADHSYALVSSAGEAVYRSSKIGEGAQSIWHKTASTWSSHLAELRDLGQTDRRLWGQMFGQVDTRDEHRTVTVPGGGNQRYDLGYRQDYYGVQLGYDLANSETFTWGLMGGYVGSKLDHDGTSDKVSFDVLNLGAYASYKSGPLFANALLKYDRSSIKASSEELDYSDRLKGNSFGAELEAGLRLGNDRLYAEPVASLAWLRTNLDDLIALGQRIEFDTADGLRGKLGGRFGGSTGLKNGSTLHFYGSAAIVHELAGTNGATLVSGGTSDHLNNARLGTFGQGSIGLNLQSAGGISTFLQGNADLGGGYTGVGGRIGLSIKL